LIAWLEGIQQLDFDPSQADGNRSPIRITGMDNPKGNGLESENKADHFGD
jgi:hypothetical protein